jgi:hypothetical protein
MTLSYLRDDCHKQAVTHIQESRRFESIYTLQGKTRPTWHVRFPRQSTYARCTLPARSPCTWQPFMSHRQIWTDPTALKKKGFRHNPHHTDWPIYGSVLSFSPKPTNEVVDLNQASVNNKLLGLLGSYHQHAIGMFNTCSREPTHRSLTDTGGGYNLEGAGFPHTTLRPSQSIVYPFHLRAPPDLRFNQVLTTKSKCWVLKNIWQPRGLSTTRPSTAT